MVCGDCDITSPDVGARIVTCSCVLDRKSWKKNSGPVTWQVFISAYMIHISQLASADGGANSCWSAARQVPLAVPPSLPIHSRPSSRLLLLLPFPLSSHTFPSSTSPILCRPTTPATATPDFQPHQRQPVISGGAIVNGLLLPLERSYRNRRRLKKKRGYHSGRRFFPRSSRSSDACPFSMRA